MFKYKHSYLSGGLLALGTFLDVLAIYISNNPYYVLTYAAKFMLLVIVYLTYKPRESWILLMDEDKMSQDISQFCLCAFFPPTVIVPLLISILKDDSVIILAVLYLGLFIQVTGVILFTFRR